MLHKKTLKLTSLTEARRTAKESLSPTEKFIPIKLRSLQEARLLKRSSTSRPDSALSLPDPLLLMNSIEELNLSRKVSSVSPKELDGLSSRSESRIFETDFGEGRGRGGEAKFEELLRADLPKIAEKVDFEEQNAEEICEKRGKLEKTNGKNSSISADTGKGEISMSKGKTEVAVKSKSKLLYPNKLVPKPIPKIKQQFQAKRPETDLLNFIEEPKLQKKLTRSQERGLLDRLQGFSTKVVKN
jgi:hypothetical protein